MLFRLWTKTPPHAAIPLAIWVEKSEPKEYTEYILEITMKSGQKHIVSFVTEFNFIGKKQDLGAVTFAKDSLRNYLKDMNEQIFILMNAEYRRVSDIEYCRIEPKRVTHLFKWIEYETQP